VVADGKINGISETKTINMKKTIMILMLLFSVTILSAQDPTVWLDAFGKYKTENVIIVDATLSKAKICDDITFWLSRVNIKLISTDTCVFVCKGQYPVQVKKFCKSKQGTVAYDLVLTIFDTKFKYVHTGFTYNDKALESKNVKAKERKQILDFLNKNILNAVQSLAQFIKDSN
jgi:hypothetical protein